MRKILKNEEANESYLEKEIIVLPEQEGLRLGVCLSEHTRSRSQAEKMIRQSLVKKKQGEVFIPVKSSHKVKTGECYHLKLPIEKQEILKPYHFPIPIIFEDEHLLVINKPAGIVTHPGPGHEQNTLVNALMEKINISPDMDPLRPGIVHRLDKDVSGLMILSKTIKVQKLVIEQFKLKKIKRIYRALVIGLAKKKEDQIISFIGRHPRDRKKFYSFNEERKGTKKAITYYRVLESFQNYIHHIECQLETGRTHQIRVHLSSQNLPVLGDAIYFPLRQQKKTVKLYDKKEETKIILKNILSLNRLALYSAFLYFTHPISKKDLSFKLSWPKELHSLMNELGFEKNTQISFY